MQALAADYFMDYNVALHTRSMLFKHFKESVYYVLSNMDYEEWIFLF